MTRLFVNPTCFKFIPWLLAVLLVSACHPIQAPIPTAAPGQSGAYTPRFEPAACPYEIAEEDHVECGYLMVPEDRSQPESPTIRVLVLNFKAKSASPAADPVIFIPGGSAAPTQFYLWVMGQTPLGEALRGQRDVLFIEHRGSNYSEPTFYCPETEMDLADVAGLSLEKEIQRTSVAYRACYDRLVAEGRNLSMYGPEETTADVADLQAALGYDEVNIYGGSWGSVIAFYLLRDHPQGIRSVVLESILPPDVNMTNELLKSAQGVLDAVFEACAADTACHKAYPDLETVFNDTLQQLRRQPVSVTVEDDSGHSYTVTIDDIKYVNYVLGLGLFGNDFTRMPAAMMTVHNQELETVAQGWLGFLAGRHGPTGPGSWAGTLAIYYVDECLQEGATTTMDKVVAAYNQVTTTPSLRDWANQLYVEDYFAQCEYWRPTPAANNRLGTTVTSDVPTLMLLSTFDQYTPPSFTDGSIQHFRQGYRLQLPTAHLPTLAPCGGTLVAQFLADPSQAPDARCIEEMKIDWVLP